MDISRCAKGSLKGINNGGAGFMAELQDRERDCNGGVFSTRAGERDAGQFGSIESVPCLGSMSHGSRAQPRC